MRKIIEIAFIAVGAVGVWFSVKDGNTVCAAVCGICIGTSAMKLFR